MMRCILQVALLPVGWLSISGQVAQNGPEYSFSGRKNKDGSYKPSSVGVSFKSEELCSLIANYMSFRERISSESDVLLKSGNTDLPLQIEKTKFMMDDTTL